jgi:AraC-like DNA-binding protein
MTAPFGAACSGLPRDHARVLRQVLGRAERKFGICGTGLELAANVPDLGKMPRPEDDAMSLTPCKFEGLRFSSEELPPADRLPYYCDVISRMFARVGVDPVGDDFSCNARLYRLPELSVAFLASSPIRGRRTAEMAKGDHGLTLIMNLDGTGTLRQAEREATVSAGDAILISNAEPFRMQWTTSRRVNICVREAMLAPMLTSPDAALMSVIPGAIEPLRLLTGYIDLLVREPALVETSELCRLAVDHVHDLIALAVGATRDAAEIATGRGLRAVRMRAIKADIVRNLDGNVSAGALSARHRISSRYIRKLFEGENTSLSQFVLGQRLARVHRMLVDPRHAGRTIGDIVLEVGFGDISTFNREFRRRFGMTPSDVRRGARFPERGHFS